MAWKSIIRALELSIVTGSLLHAQIGSSAPTIAFTPKGGSFASNQELGANPDSLRSQTGARALGDSAAGDDCERIDGAILNAAQATNFPAKVIHLGGGHWRCKDARYLVILPGDKGDYLNTFSGAGAQFSLNIINGKISSCDVSGGIGYNPSSYIIGQVIDYARKGSGGAVSAMADGNGTPRPGSCVVASAGIGYSSPHDVTTVSFAQGGDGASATLTLKNGTVQSANIVPNGSTMPNGNGYTSTPTTGLPATFKCSTNPVITLTRGKSGLSSTAITGISSSSGAKCLYRNSDSGIVPVFIGASDPSGTSQAVNIAPEPVSVLPCAIQLRQGVVIDGDGALLEADWASSAYTLTASKAIFCDAFGDQSVGVAIRNMTLSSLADVWLSGKASSFTLENIKGEYSAPQGPNSGGTKKGIGGGLLFYAAQTGPNTQIKSVSTESPGAIVIGGQWTSRAGNSGLGSMGGADISRGSSERGGIYTNLSIDGLSQSGFAIPPAAPRNSYSPGLDAFFEQYVWKSQNSPATNPRAPNGTGACRSPMTISIRQVDTAYGVSGPSSQFYNCYRGVSDMLFVGISRTSSVSVAVSLRDLHQGSAYRPAVLASIDQSRIWEASFSQGTGYVDPYLPDGAKSMGVVEIHNSLTLNGPPSIELQNISIPTYTGFASPISVTQGPSTKMGNACLWGISGVKNSCLNISR